MPKPRDYDRPALAALLGRQHAVLTRQQALSCGLSVGMLNHRVRPGGPWQVLLPGVYVTHGGQPTVVQQEMAALLYAGPRSVLTGAAALRRHGLYAASRNQGPAVGSPAVDVLVPASTQRLTTEFVRLHRTSRLTGRVCVKGEIRFVFPERAIADAVRGLELPEVRAAAAEAVQRGRCTVALLARELATGPVHGSASLRQALAEIAAGVRSAAEADLRDLIAWARLPEPLYNPRLFVGAAYLASPDCWWPDAGVAAEVDSREWHLSPADWENTLTRHARMSAQGIIVLHFTPRRIRTARAEVASQVRGALASGGARALPHIRTVPAG